MNNNFQHKITQNEFRQHLGSCITANFTLIIDDLSKTEKFHKYYIITQSTIFYSEKTNKGLIPKVRTKSQVTSTNPHLGT